MVQTVQVAYRFLHLCQFQVIRYKSSEECFELQITRVIDNESIIIENHKLSMSEMLKFT